MRLTKREREIIQRAVCDAFGAQARAFLFGSRTDDARRGGDIDLYIESELPFAESFAARTRLGLLLEERLGEQRIDILVRHAGMRGDPAPIYRVARGKGIPL